MIHVSYLSSIKINLNTSSFEQSLSFATSDIESVDSADYEEPLPDYELLKS